jgi:carbon monoxide dehydrogenase subunit G
MDFAFWIQLKEVAPNDTRVRMVVHADLNMMLKMMIGNEIQKSLDDAVTQLAASLNQFK